MPISFKCLACLILQLYSSYVKLCQEKKLRTESQSEFVSIVGLVEARGLLQTVKKSKDIMASMVRWTFCYSIVSCSPLPYLHQVSTAMIESEVRTLLQHAMSLTNRDKIA